MRNGPRTAGSATRSRLQRIDAELERSAPAPLKPAPGTAREKGFSRADKNKDGKIEAEELLGTRRKAFAKLDSDGNGALRFEEWAPRTISKFEGADGVRTATEYATTAPPPPKHKICSCTAAPSSASIDY